MENIFTWIKENWANILAIYGGIVVIADTIVKLTPNSKDDEIWAKIKAFIAKLSRFNTKSDEEKLAK